MSLLIISSSLNPDSRSRVMAKTLHQIASDNGQNVTIIDLQDYPLPFCDGKTAYGHENVLKLNEIITQHDGIIVASPIYNYEVSSSFKNLVELTGRQWTNKLVGFMCAAGGQNSYMAIMSMANNLMLDFRCLIVPRFVYAASDMFEGDTIKDEGIVKRIHELNDTMENLITRLS